MGRNASLLNPTDLLQSKFHQNLYISLKNLFSRARAWQLCSSPEPPCTCAQAPASPAFLHHPSSGHDIAPPAKGGVTISDRNKYSLLQFSCFSVSFLVGVRPVPQGKKLHQHLPKSHLPTGKKPIIIIFFRLFFCLFVVLFCFTVMKKAHFPPASLTAMDI